MNINDTVALFNCLNLKVEVRATGSSEYHRGFITNSGGISLGRITFYNGEYSHVKWYWRQYGELVDSDRPIFLWSHLLSTGEIITEEVYKSLVQKAENLSHKDYQSKLQWRKQNPKVDRNGNVKSRKKLTGRSPRAFMWELLNNRAKADCV